MFNDKGSIPLSSIQEGLLSIVSFQDGNIFDQSQEFDKTMLNFKQCVGIVRSTIPIVEEEREVFETHFQQLSIFTIFNCSFLKSRSNRQNIKYRVKNQHELKICNIYKILNTFRLVFVGYLFDFYFQLLVEGL